LCKKYLKNFFGLKTAIFQNLKTKTSKNSFKTMIDITGLRSNSYCWTAVCVCVLSGSFRWM